MRGHTRHVSQALVIAAGNGSRLNSDTPKQLLPLLGVPLLARTLFTLERAGIEKAYVVLGYRGHEIRRAIESVRGLGLELHWLYNDEWRQPNGLSVLAAESDLDEPFILTMTDHLFDPDVVRRLAESAHDLKGIDLAVDYDVDGVFDLDDATKVRVESDRIVEIGKTLETYDAIDTGVFLASPVLFGALRDARTEGDGSLSGGVQKLASAGLARVTDIGGRMWHDIDTREDAAEAERKLLAGLRRPTDGPVARYINRPISIALSRRLVRTSVTPNQVSVATLVLGLVSAGLAALGGYVPFLLSGLLFQAGSILDGSDGEIAKLTFSASVRGEWVDTICDNLSYVAFLLGLMIGVVRSPLPSVYVWSGLVGFAAVSASLANIHVYLRREKESGSALSVQYGWEEGTDGFRRLMRVLKYFGKRDVMAFEVMLLAIVGQLPLVLPIAGVGATALLLPATTVANVRSLWRFRRSHKVIPISTARGDRGWLPEVEPEPVRERAASAKR
ncbi:MAG: NTP transferase domain-containing protein [Gemmatimonadota bacterium]